MSRRNERQRPSTGWLAAWFVTATFLFPGAPASGPAPHDRSFGERFAELRAQYGDMTYAELARHVRLSPAAESPLGFDPTRVGYYDRVRKALDLTKDEEALYRRRGLVSVDHAQRYSMAGSYLAIYRNDLPVLITTDSILHAMHRSFDEILAEIEVWQLMPAMTTALQVAHDKLKAEPTAYGDAGPRTCARDVDIYLTVVRNLLAAPDTQAFGADQEPDCTGPTPPGGERCKDIVAAEIVRPELKVHSAFGQDGAVKDLLKGIASLKSTPEVRIYGGRRSVDWSQFKPRGHYANSEALRRYFRAMMWLGRADLGFDPAATGGRELRAATALSSVLSRSGQLEPLGDMSRLIDFLVGAADNLTPAEVAAVGQRAGLRSLARSR